MHFLVFSSLLVMLGCWANKKHFRWSFLISHFFPLFYYALFFLYLFLLIFRRWVGMGRILSLSPSLTHHIFYFLTFDDIFSFSFHLQYLLTVWLKWKLTHGQYAHKRITTCLYHIILSSQPNPNKLVEFLPFLFFSSFCAAYTDGCTDSSSTKSSLALEPIVSLIFIFLFMFTCFVQSHNFLPIITFHIYLFLFLIFIIFPRDEMKRKTTVLLETFRYTHLNYFGEKCRLHVF